jgi:hypothetical protein
MTNTAHANFSSLLRPSAYLLITRMPSSMRIASLDSAFSQSDLQDRKSDCACYREIEAKESVNGASG